MYATMRDPGPVAEAAREFWRTEAGDDPLVLLRHQVCAEAGVWEERAARTAINRARGDVARAVTLLRVWAATLPSCELVPVPDREITVLRRVTAAFRDTPEGEWVGPSLEFDSRLLDAAPEGTPGERPSPGPEAEPPNRADISRVRDLLDATLLAAPSAASDGADPSEEPLVAPVTRATALGHLARAETGALVATAMLVLSGRREAIIVESALLAVPITVAHPRTGAPCAVGEVPLSVTEAVVDADAGEAPGLRLAVGVTLGALERRSIAIALLDGALEDAAGGDAPRVRLDAPTMLGACDGLATSGFVEHLRLPHYASFASYVEQLRAIRDRACVA